MSEHNKHLLLRILPQQAELSSAGTVAWNLVDERGELTSGVSSIAELGVQVGDVVAQCSVSVIVPGLDVLLCNVATPTSNSRQLNRALPFLVEELLAEELENVHLALAEPLDLSAGNIDVMAISHRVLIHYLDVLHSNKLSPDRLSPDILAVPRLGGSWSVLVDAEDIIIRTGVMAGMVAVVDDLEIVFSSLVARDSSGEAGLVVTVIASDGEAENIERATVIATFLRDNYPLLEVKEDRYRESVSQLLLGSYLAECDGPGTSSAANFLQGGYRVTEENSSGWEPWRPAASLAAMGLMVFLLFSLGSGWYFTAKATALAAENKALYQQLFPSERRIVSPKKQFQNHLRLAASPAAHGSFLALLTQFTASVFPVADAANGRSPAAISMVKLRYDQAVDGLHLELQSKTIDQLDLLKNNLADVGLHATVNSATEQGDTMVARLLVERL